MDVAHIIVVEESLFDMQETCWLDIEYNVKERRRNITIRHRD